MKKNPTIVLRAETKFHERRCALTPKDAKTLLATGFNILVEKCSFRIFTDSEYESVGCNIVAHAYWKQAPKSNWILGLKELPDNDQPLIHRHIYFAHCFKHQKGSDKILNRFKKGNGALYDLEFLKFPTGRRVAAFGKWAGFAGAGLAVQNWCAQIIREKNQKHPLLHDLDYYDTKEDFLELLKEDLKKVKKITTSKPKILIIGSRGRSGQGAVKCVESLGLSAHRWGLRETKNKGPFEAILKYSILVNAVLVDGSIQPFLTTELLSKNKQLRVISDVSCDPHSPFNPLPIYTDITTFKKPIKRLKKKPVPLDLIAIDHLPSLLPRESSHEFSRDLLPFLLDLKNTSPVWREAKKTYLDAVKSLK